MDQSGSLSQTRLAQLDDALRLHVGRGEVAGLVALVARRDAVHVAAIGVQDVASAAPMRRDSIFRIASMTKPITAAAMMILIEESRIRLDDPVERWLPELASRRVLRSIESPIDDTVPAARPITLRDLLTFRFGLGAVMAMPGTYPIQAAMAELGVAPGHDQVAAAPDDYMRRIGRLPLIHQPGEKWMYHTGADILGVLIARLAGVPLADFLRERIFAPLRMRDTGFSVPDTAIDRLATCYARDPKSGDLTVWDAARGGRYASPPVFPSLLVSTADDFLAFGRMLLQRGRHTDVPILAPASIALMMTDHITPEQKAASAFFPGFWDTKGWGFGGAVVTRRDPSGANPGSYGWSGGFGTNFIVDPAADMVAILLVQRVMRGPNDGALNEEFLRLAYQAIDD
jgi:CubicO group peptidase (beta-lactamase class C family)